MKPKSNPFLRSIALAATIVLSFAASAFAATYQWNGSKDSVWTDTANWNSGAVPVSGSHRININNGTPAAPTNEAIYNLGTTLTIGSNADRGLVIGSPGGSNGSLRITSGTISTANNTTSTTVADIIGNGNGSTAVLTIDGGNFVGGASPMSMGFGGGPTCTLTLTTNGGSFTAASLAFNNTTGTVNLDGGTLAVNTITRSGGTNTINLNGGTLKPRVTSPTFIGNLSSTTVRVKSGGARIDTSGDAETGVDATIALPLLQDPASTGGGLTKNGPGTLTLTGVHTFTGGIAINEGTLALNPTAPYTYNGNITGTGTGALSIGGVGPVLLGGSMIPDITVASGAGFGGEGSTSGSLTLSGTNTFYFNPSTTGASEHFRAASIDATGATVSFLTFGGSGAATGVVVMESTGSNIVGDIGTEFTENPRIQLSFNDNENPTQLLADYTPGALVWKGNDALNPTFWNTNTTGNWFNNTTSSDDTFIAGDTVLFDDTAGPGTVAIQGTVFPSSVTFSNDTLEYTLSGGAIAGSGTLTVSGPGTVNLTAANSYTGGTTLNGGVVNAPISNALGGGPVAVNTGATLNLTSTGSGNFGYFGINTGAATLTGGGIINVSLGTGTATRQFNGNNSGFIGTMNIGVGAAAGAGKAQIQGSLGAATVNVLQNATVYVASPTANHPAAITLNGGDTGESAGQLRLDAGSTWSGTVTLAGDITGTGDGFIGSTGGTNTISGAINESGGAKALSKVGGGKIISTVANGYTGATNILGGTLTIQNVGGLSGAGTTVANNASLELDGGLDMPTESLNLTGGGAGAGGALRSASGNNTWNGAITTAGVCRIEAVADLLTLDENITLPAPGGSNQLTLQGAGNIDVNGTISDNTGGAGTLSSSANGDGIRTLHAANDYTGPTNINGGKLVITNAQALGTTDGGTSIAGEGFGGGSLVLPGGLTISGEALTLGGRKDATIDNPHLINQSGNNTWTGDMTFNIGGLDYNIESQAGLLTISGQISGGGIGSTRNLKLMGDGNGEVSGAIINGTGTTLVQITKRGGGTWTLSGTNLYSGNTVIEDGTIALASTGQMRFAPATNGVNNAVSGTGTFNADGSFLIDLGGADTTDGNSWLLVDDSSLASLTYGTNFSVTSSAGTLSESSPGVWEITDSGKAWTFDESTGALTVVDAAGGGYSTWADDNAGGQTADLDFDKDGVANGVEYFMGETGSGFTTSPTSFANNKATWTNGGNIPSGDYGTQFWIQTSTNLVNWTDVLASDPNLENLSGSVSYTLTGSGKEFMRLKVTPD